jgi:hypothetical protein
MPDTDKLAVARDEIRKRAANELEKWRLTPEPSGGIHMAAHDVPRLLAAVDAALAFADFLEIEPKSPAPMGGWAAARRYYARRLREGLSRALLAEDAEA